MNLEAIRKKIDILDTKLLKLLNDRMELVTLLARFKKKIEDKDREREILDRISKNLGRLADPELCKRLFLQIIDYSKKIQSRSHKLIAFQGEHGAYSEIAAKKWNNEYITISCREFGQIFNGIIQGEYDYGIIPVENTLGGVVGEVNDLLLNSNLFVVGAVDMVIHHSLLSIPGVKKDEIRSLYSHPQALAQCRNFIKKNNFEPLPYYDTAGAARLLIDELPEFSGAIASNLASELYNLTVLEENIEDLKTNKTRFLIISKDQNKEDNDKCSIAFSAIDKAGSLFNVLEKFAKEDINLTRIESVPGKPGSYIFFLDFAGKREDKRVIRALNSVRKITRDLKILGYYKEKRFQ